MSMVAPIRAKRRLPDDAEDTGASKEARVNSVVLIPPLLFCLLSSLVRMIRKRLRLTSPGVFCDKQRQIVTTAEFARRHGKDIANKGKAPQWGLFIARSFLALS